MYQIIKITPTGTKVLTFETRAEADAALKALTEGENGEVIKIDFDGDGNDEGEDYEIELDDEEVASGELDEDTKKFVDQLDPETSSLDDLIKFRTISRDRLEAVLEVLGSSAAASEEGMQLDAEELGFPVAVIPLSTLRSLQSIVGAYLLQTDSSMQQLIKRKMMSNKDVPFKSPKTRRPYGNN